MTERVCTGCGETKDKSEFHRRSERPSGTVSKCKVCRNAHQRSGYTTDKLRPYRLSKFGLTVEEYDALEEGQGFVCKICGEPETALSNTGYVKRLAVDHCHKTGEVRGLLCMNCNAGLGHFKDDVDLLLKAIQHLKEKL